MEQRIEKLNSDLGLSQAPGNGQIFDLVCLYGSMTLHLVAGVAIVLVSIQILDLGPALLAATLPFNIDSKLLTRGTGIFLFLSSYFFVFRLSYLASRVRAKTLPRSPMFQEKAQAEIDNLRHRLAATTTQVTRAGAKMTPEEAKLR